MSAMQDLRFAIRLLKKDPAFGALVVVTLALGIGASTAAFSAMSGMLWYPLPYPGGDRLVSVWQESVRSTGSGRSLVNYLDYETWQRSARSIESIAVATWGWEWTSPTLTGEGPARPLPTAAVSDRFFSMLDVAPLVGRTFVPSDLQEGCALVLSHRFWTNTLGARPIVGERLVLNQRPCLVVGVMPATFSFYPRDVEAWTLITNTFEPSPRSLYVSVFARLKPDVTISQAQTEFRTLYRAAHAADQEAQTQQPRVFGLVDEFTALAGNNLPSTLWLLLAATGLLLAIACLNVATLLGARALVRSQEMAVRIALGSGRGRLVRQFVVESLILAAMGGVGGAILAAACVKLLMTRSPIELPVGADLRISIPVLLFTTAVCLGTAVATAIRPAWRTATLDLSAVLKARRHGHDRGRQRSARALLMAQTALAVVLLFASTLLLSTVARMDGEDLGFRATNLSVVPVSVPPGGYPDPASRIEFLNRTDDSVRALPGVEDLAFASSAPPRSFAAGVALLVSGRPAPDSGAPQDVVPVTVSSSYFSVLGVTLRAGRGFDSRDRLTTEPVAIVNESLARTYFPSGDVLGQRVRIVAAAPWRTIVGVVSNEKQNALLGGTGWMEPPELFTPTSQSTRASAISMLVQTSNTGAAPSAGELKQALATVDPLASLGEVRSVEQRVATMMAGPRFRALLLTGFAGFALLLVALGINAVVNEFVTQRTRDTNIRLALGAGRWHIARIVTLYAGVPVAVGLVVGAVGARATASVIVRFIYGAQPTDPLVIAAVCGGIGGSMLLALWKPLSKATRLDPNIALRAD